MDDQLPTQGYRPHRSNAPDPDSEPEQTFPAIEPSHPEIPLAPSNLLPTPMYYPVPSRPQIPNNNLLSCTKHTPSSQQMFNNQQIPLSQQIPGNPQNSGYRQAPDNPPIPENPQISGYRRMSSHQQIPVYQQMPGSQQIPGQQFPGYQQTPSYQYDHNYHSQHQGSTLDPPFSVIHSPSAVDGQALSNVHSSSIAYRAPNSPAASIYGLQDYPGTPAALPTTDTRSSPHSPYATVPQSPTMPPKATDSLEVIIALMGVTGAGKSYFIREVTGDSRAIVGGGLNSCTSEAQSFTFQYKGINIILVDTPGFDDTKKSDTEILKNISDWTSEIYREKRLLSGIIYLHRITDIRMGGSALKNLEMLQKLCGNNALGNVFLTTTQWSKVDPEVGKFRETELQGTDFWGSLLEKGAAIRRFQGSRESGLDLIRELMSKTPKPLNIQEEMVDQHKTLIETEAGQSINEELIAQEKRYKEELESLEREREEAIMAKDDEMKEMIAEEQAKAQEKLASIAAEKEVQAELHATENKKREIEMTIREEIQVEADEQATPSEAPVWRIDEAIPSAEPDAAEIRKLKAEEMIRGGMHATEQAHPSPERARCAAEVELAPQRHAAEIESHEAKERKRVEDEKCMIAVDASDIQFPIHIVTSLWAYRTRGRFIANTSNNEEFKSEYSRVAIKYDGGFWGTTFKIISGLVISDCFGMSSQNFIDYNGTRYRYWHKSNSVVKIDSRKFIIFHREEK